MGPGMFDELDKAVCLVCLAAFSVGAIIGALLVWIWL